MRIDPAMNVPGSGTRQLSRLFYLFVVIDDCSPRRIATQKWDV